MRHAASVFARSKHMVGRKIGGEYVLVPIVSRGADLDSVFCLNRVAAFVWERLDGQRSGAQIVRELAEHFEVDESRAAEDYEEFLEQLLSIGAVEEGRAGAHGEDGLEASILSPTQQTTMTLGDGTDRVLSSPEGPEARVEAEGLGEQLPGALLVRVHAA